MIDQDKVLKFAAVLFFGGAVALLGAQEIYSGMKTGDAAASQATQDLVFKLHGVSQLERGRWSPAAAEAMLASDQYRERRREEPPVALNRAYNSILPKEP